MRFKEGSRVEVLRKKREAYGSWFPAKVLSKINNMYTISYELYLTGKGEPVVEKVHEKDIRPCPPVSLEVESWVLGDIAEVLDLCSWRVGKIAKALKNNYFVVRLFGSIQLKRFHISNLRVRQAWQHNRWISLEKGSGKKNAIDNAFPDDTEGRVNKRRGTLNAVPFSNDLLNQNIVEEDIECSVASCSAIDLPKVTVQNNRTTKSCREISDTSFHAASSSFAPIPGKKEELAENVHELELHAYKSTVQALYASGPLSWEQESLLTNLRMCLHISNEEHLLQVWDLGGQDRLRASWATYYRGTHAVIVVIDSTDRARISIIKDELFRLLQHGDLEHSVVLVFANKQDLKDAMSPAEITDALSLHGIKNHDWHIQACCAVTGDGLYEGLSWIAQHVGAKPTT